MARLVLYIVSNRVTYPDALLNHIRLVTLQLSLQPLEGRRNLLACDIDPFFIQFRLGGIWVFGSQLLDGLSVLGDILTLLQELDGESEGF